MNPWLILRIASLLVSAASVALSYQLYADRKRRYDDFRNKPEPDEQQREQEELFRRQQIQKHLENEWKKQR